MNHTLLKNSRCRVFKKVKIMYSAVYERRKSPRIAITLYIKHRTCIKRPRKSSKRIFINKAPQCTFLWVTFTFRPNQACTHNVIIAIQYSTLAILPLSTLALNNVRLYDEPGCHVNGGEVCSNYEEGKCCFGFEPASVDLKEFQSADIWPGLQAKTQIYAGPVGNPCTTVLSTPKDGCIDQTGAVGIGGAVWRSATASKRARSFDPKKRNMFVQTDKFFLVINETEFHLDIESEHGAMYRELKHVPAKIDFMSAHGYPVGPWRQ